MGLTKVCSCINSSPITRDVLRLVSDFQHGARKSVVVSRSIYDVAALLSFPLFTRNDGAMRLEEVVLRDPILCASGHTLLYCVR